MIYEPQEDSYLLLEALKKVVKPDHLILDMGTGTGLLADAASKITDKVVAVDINPESIDLCTKNHRKTGIIFKQSDLFENVNNKFDIIVFNPPYLPLDEDEPEDLRTATTGGKHGHEIIGRFMESASDYLVDDGKILLLFSTLTNKEKVEEAIKSNLFEFKNLSEQKISFENLFVYSITKSAILKRLHSHGIINIRRLTKGHRGLIFTGSVARHKVAIKMQRTDIGASGTVNNEIQQLKTLNKKGIGPEVLFSGKDYFVYKFVEGDFILDAFENSDKHRIKKIMINVLDQCFTMDQMKLNKEEMHHPVKHVLVKGASIVMLDFERCKFTQKPGNVTQFCQFITSGLVRHVFDRKKLSLDKYRIMKTAQLYKRSLEKRWFDALKDLISEA
ncbi:MAG: HemK2/MTQ2 family protein methyltransferase [Candidatus Nanoarchaeia archaeon]